MLIHLIVNAPNMGQIPLLSIQLHSENKLSLKTEGISFVSWCLEPSQPQRVISGLISHSKFDP